MKAPVILFFLFGFLTARYGHCQQIQVIVPTQPIVAGTAFQVQYVITHPQEFEQASTPEFDSCQVISGPHVYRGNALVEGRLQPIQNIAYTLVSNRTGLLKIGRLHASFRNLPDAESPDAGVTVIPPPRASFSARSSYTDAKLNTPPSPKDREKLIQDNLFIRAEVNKKICYAGDPLIATFTLYSRLSSSSEAEKSPAFYGFSVVDMLNLNEAHTAVKTIDGKIFNTSVLRQVQLYPVQAGELTVDEMYVQNTISFDDSIGGGHTEVEKEIITKPLTIQVKPLPPGKPEDFTGAVGQFTLEAQMEKKELSLNDQGRLVIRLKGKGNFIQFGAPLVPWPSALEPFEPLVRDQLDRNTTPMEGERTYTYGFAADVVGDFNLPPIRFAFFDPAAGTYRELYTDTLRIRVLPTQKKQLHLLPPKKALPLTLLLAGLLVAGLGILVFYRNRKQKRKKAPQPDPSQKIYAERLASLKRASLSAEQTCLELQKLLQDFLQHRGQLVPAWKREALQLVLQKCQLCLYSHTDREDLKNEVLEKAAILLEAAG
ncbi:MAG: BatD family protein [Flavisolibacter sp.]